MSDEPSNENARREGQGSEAERRFLADLTGGAAWELVERFATLNRESGSEDERVAARTIAQRLQEAGVPVEVYTPELYLSLPRGARVSIDGATPLSLTGKTPSFSVSTGDQGTSGRLVYLPSNFAQGSGDLFDSNLRSAEGDLAGAVVVTEGLPLPQKVLDIRATGATAAVFVNPGERIHEAICTPIWGGPDLESADRRPTLAVASVNRPDGERILAAVKAAQASGRSLTATVCTWLEEGLYPCPVTVATIPGSQEPEKFVLLHGHLDSWHYGIGDNAVGDGALLELAIGLWRNRASLRRSVRIAWWPGHSQGRYAGSTWYADRFGVDLAENAVAHVNCDSPGCRWATVFEEVSWMPELAAFTQEAIRDVTGLDSSGERPPRAGDWSFNNLGVSGTLMLSSTMPDPLRKEKGYYGVGGCGGNIEWHTEADTLEVADREILTRDIKVYGAVVWRLATCERLPFRFRATVADMKAALDRYASQAQDRFDLDPVAQELDKLDRQLARLEAADTLAATAVNEALLRVGRILVRLHFAKGDPFRQDPALQVPPLPDLAPAGRLAQLEPGSLEAWFTRTSLVRGRNRVVHGLREAQRVVEGVLKGV
ncbi:M28 family metallopeptidase [Limnochorda pilosa]|uniref:Peptidase M28 n=1 Tax=Limnochorda pilosa TaxID=1555112 RepID=A0A0K2SLK0_LIMPI|nr:M28 family peptidase [Limnochorda pilosa]BAS28001.1 peptidase M28 [Limnochorda pilosa]